MFRTYLSALSPRVPTRFITRVRPKKKHRMYKKVGDDDVTIGQDQTFEEYQKDNLVNHNGIVDYRRLIKPAPNGWTPQTRRVGLIAEKLGMMRIVDKWGILHPVTVVRADACNITQLKPCVQKISKQKLMAVQLGVGWRKPRRANKARIGHCAAAGLALKRRLYEFKVTPDNIDLLQPGQRISARHFFPGQYVDVTGITKGKGTCGVMKRFGYAGLGASHGTTKKHRSGGSIGQCQNPSRVWKGTQMAGKTGNKQRTQEALKIMRICPRRNLIFIRGCIPGNKKSYVRIRDTLVVDKPMIQIPEFPTYVPKEGDSMEMMDVEAVAEDPFGYKDLTQGKRGFVKTEGKVKKKKKLGKRSKKRLDMK